MMGRCVVYILLVLIGVIAGRALGAVKCDPANGAVDVCPDTPLRIEFDSAPLPPPRSGKIQIFDDADHSLVESIDVGKTTASRTIGGLANFNYYPVIVSGNEAAIYPAVKLAYGRTYFVRIDAGAFGGVAVPTDWRFATRTAPPAAGTRRLIVAADGSGDFRTVQGALNFLPDGNTSPTTIFLKKGVYTEQIYFAGKHSITLLGEDRGRSVIQYANNNNFNSARGIYHRGVLLARGCNDFTLANLTIRNTTPQGGSQAEAIIFNGTTSARAIVSNVDLYSFQDTLQINGQAFVRNCYIEGDVDFLWGTGPCFFENCRCHSVRSRAYYTQIRNPATNHGYVFHHCRFDGEAGVTGNYLSRIEPGRFPASEVVLIDCIETESVGAVGWRLDRGSDPAQVHFWEYNCRTPDGRAIDVSRRAGFSRQLALPADRQTIADYSDPGFVLGGWTPKLPRDLK